MTIKCASEEEATLVEDALAEKYRKAILIKPVTPTPAQGKITRLYLDLIALPNIEAQLRRQNVWLDQQDFEIDRFCEVNANAGKNKNIIVSCDIKIHELFLQQGSVTFGLQQCKVYAYVSILLCRGKMLIIIIIIFCRILHFNLFNI